jgi:glycosyltransferase involved in cell wall biosynthesis
MPAPAPGAPPVPDSVVVVATAGSGSMDRYGRQLADALGGPSLVLGTSATSAGRFGTPLLSREALRHLAGDVAVVRRLRALPGLPHLTHHHLARYGALLGRPFLLTAHDLIRRADLLGTARNIAPLGERDAAGVRLDLAGFRRALRLVAPSEATKRELVRDLGIPAERITVVPEAIDHTVFRPTARRLHPGPYLLAVGSDHPRKDLPTLLRAFARIASAHPDLVLVKVGEPGDGEAPFGERTRAVIAELGLQRRVLLTGAVPRDDLVAWYSGALALSMVSRAEGFGLPPLEAMACGTPVVVSSAGALPEVAGPAALVVPPADPAALARALDRLVRDAGLRASLRARGLAHAARFHAERVAAETAAVHAEALAELGGRTAVGASVRAA